jgi:hypothetical protein
MTEEWRDVPTADEDEYRYEYVVDGIVCGYVEAFRDHATQIEQAQGRVWDHRSEIFESAEQAQAWVETEYWSTR